MARLSFTVTGMNCTGCEQRISTILGRLDGVGRVSADHIAGTVDVDFDPAAASESMITERLATAGYERSDVTL